MDDSSHIYLIRHGESVKNVIREKIKKESIKIEITKDIIDCPLTELGTSQAMKASSEMKDKNIKIVLTSPYLRTLQTANLIFGDHPSQPKIVVLPTIREYFFAMKDIPQPITETIKLFPNYDFSFLDKEDNSHLWFINSFMNKEIKELFYKEYMDNKSDVNDYIIDRITLPNQDFIESKLDLVERCNKTKEIIKKYLEEYKPNEICLVSHAYFLSTFIADEYDEDGGVANRRIINNCEIIKYKLE